MQPQLYIGAEKLDLFPDESINYNQSVQSLKDLTKVFTDFTKSFKIPANDTNNAIFKHYYQNQIDNGFDARIKTNARIDINGVTFKKGKLQLNSVGLKSNVPEFYDVEFFGDTIDIKDKIGDDTLRDLDGLSTLDFTYNAANVKSRLETDGDLAFGLASYKRRFLSGSTNLSTETAVNINYNSSFTDGIDWKELKPFIKCSSILSAIESQPGYGLQFSRDFFGRAEFDRLYMSISSGTSNEDAPFREKLVQTLPISLYPIVFVSLFGNRTAVSARVKMYFRIVPVEQNIPYRLVWSINGEVKRVSETLTGEYAYLFRSDLLDLDDYDLQYSVQAEGDLNFEVNCEQTVTYFSSDGLFANQPIVQTTVFDSIAAPDFNVQSQISNMKVLDWFSAMLKAFNLVIVPQPDGVLYVNDLNSWYRDGAILDVSEYVDIEELKVSRGELFNEIVLGYEDTEQILAKQYQSQFGKQFGAEDITIENISLDKKLEVKLPFENPQFERINDTYVQYAYVVDTEQEPYENKPFLTYLQKSFLGSGDLRLGFNTESTYQPLTSVNVLSHSLLLLAGFSCQFGAEFSEFNGRLMDDNLYSRFYSDYFNDLFNKKRRKYNLSAEFTPTILAKLEMNDRLIIKGERYVIDNIETNIITGKTSLVLLNDLFTTLEGSETSSRISQKKGTFFDKGSFYYTGNAKVAQAFTENSFITITSQPPLVSFDLDVNKTGEDRVGVIQIQDGLSDPSFIILQLSENVLLFDSNIITFDNNKITF